MKILGISGSPRSTEISGTYWTVEKVLQATGLEYELISLAKLNIRGCTSCLGCAKDNICVIKDDLTKLRDKIVEADAYVIGAPNYYSGINVVTHAFLERFFQFRHQASDILWGKLAVAVGIGGVSGTAAADEIEKFLAYNFIETVSKVSGQGSASCYSCRFGETCRVGIPIMLHGEGMKISPELIPDVRKDQDLIKAAQDAGELLAERLKSHSRAAVTEEMQIQLMDKFDETV